MDVSIMHTGMKVNFIIIAYYIDICFMKNKKYFRNKALVSESECLEAKNTKKVETLITISNIACS
jgi:hypothetical protein